MIKHFDTQSSHDPNFLEVTIADEDSKFILEIMCRNAAECNSLRNRVTSLCRIYEMDSPTRQHFSVSMDDKHNLVRIMGNIHNAITLLYETQLIS